MAGIGIFLKIFGISKKECGVFKEEMVFNKKENGSWKIWIEMNGNGHQKFQNDFQKNGKWSAKKWNLMF